MMSANPQPKSAPPIPLEAIPTGRPGAVHDRPSVNMYSMSPPGPGGGGMGGHSIGVAYKGSTAPDTGGAQIIFGAPGVGGTGDGDTGKGADGVAAMTQKF